MLKKAMTGLVIASMCLVTTNHAFAKGKIAVAWRGNGQELKVLNMVADAFQQKTGIKAVITPVQDDAKLLAMTISGVMPDVFSSVYNSGLYDYVRRGLCEDLTPYIKKDKVELSSFFPGAIKRHKYAGKQYGLPISGTPFTTWHNKTLLDQAGVTPPPTDWDSRSWTWDDMVANAIKLTKDTNGDGKMDQWGFGGGFWPETTCAWIWGGDFFPESIYDTGLAPKSTVTSEAALKGLQKWMDLKTKHKVVANVPGWDSDSFVKGKIAIYQDSLHSFISAYKAYPASKSGKWGVGIMPVGTAPAKPVLFTDPWLLAKGSRNKDAAWKWIKFTVLEEGAAIMANNYAIAPMSKKYLPEYFKQHGFINSIQKVTEGALEIGEESPNHTISRYNEVMDIINVGLNKVFQGKASPAEAMKGVQSKLDAELARNYQKYSKR